jgi:hypothetical protein
MRQALLDLRRRVQLGAHHTCRFARTDGGVRPPGMLALCDWRRRLCQLVYSALELGQPEVANLERPCGLGGYQRMENSESFQPANLSHASGHFGCRTCWVQEQIAGLEVAMDHPLRMDVS